MNRIKRTLCIVSMLCVNTSNMPSQHTSANFKAEAKQQAAMSLVQKGIAYMKSNAAQLDHIFNQFTDGQDFIIGELYLFVYDEKGVCLAHGQQKDFVWKDMWNYRDNYGVAVVQNMIKKAQEGGGWLTYKWRNATKVSYLQAININGKNYIVGCGYYPHAKEDVVVGLVKSAVALFAESMLQGKTVEDVFALLSYPEGQFALGDLYLYALRFDGVVFAQADRTGLIGKNIIDMQDATGKKINQIIIEKLKETSDGIWTEYMSKKALKKVYAQKVADNKGNDYFIACGYYPDADRKKAIDLVRLAYHGVKSNGLIVTKNIINDKKDDQFGYGDLYVEIYAVDGTCLANGRNHDLVDQNFWNAVDQDGKFYVRDMINKALQEPGWIDYKLHNFFKSTYVQKVSFGNDHYIICCGLYPISKRETAILMVKTAVDFFNTHTREKAFKEFTEKRGKFIRGDLGIFVFDYTGLCLAYGDHHNLIWKNLLDVKDDDGRSYVRLFINTSKNGPGQVSFRKDGARTIAYVEAVQKDGKSYVIGSHYYI